MLYKTKLGEIPVEKEDIVNFESGLPGFEQWRRYALISLPETEPIQWLISLDNSAITFPVLDPWLVKKRVCVRYFSGNDRVFGYPRP